MTDMSVNGRIERATKRFTRTLEKKVLVSNASEISLATQHRSRVCPPPPFSDSERSHLAGSVASCHRATSSGPDTVNDLGRVADFGSDTGLDAGDDLGFGTAVGSGSDTAAALDIFPLRGMAVGLGMVGRLDMALALDMAAFVPDKRSCAVMA